MNLLGIDFGLRHTGIALSEANIAYPLTTINTSLAAEHLKKLIPIHKIQKIIIGEADPKIKPQLETFISTLPQPIEVVLCDETLSSKDATQALLHTSPSKRKSKNHQVSAAIILQSYIDTHLVD